MQLASCAPFETRGQAFIVFRDAAEYDAGGQKSILPIEYRQHEADCDDGKRCYKDQVSWQNFGSHFVY
jgi:hypothetical protein